MYDADLQLPPPIRHVNCHVLANANIAHTATDVADYLTEKGMPFRLAHEITSQTVAYCIKNEKTLQNITLKELKNISPQFSADVFNHITLRGSVQKKNVYGGTAKKQVLAQIIRLDKKLKVKFRFGRKK